MTAATEAETRRIMQDHKIRPVQGDSCFHHALRAAMTIFATEFVNRRNQDAEFPRIIEVKVGDDVHAYLVHEGRVYSSGITDFENRYPPYDLRTVNRIGKDRTFDILAHVVQAFNTGSDELGFGNLVENLFRIDRKGLGMLIGLATQQVGGFSDAEIFP